MERTIYPVINQFGGPMSDIHKPIIVVVDDDLELGSLIGISPTNGLVCELFESGERFRIRLLGSEFLVLGGSARNDGSLFVENYEIDHLSRLMLTAASDDVDRILA